MKLMMDTFITHRQMGESEAIYKIFPDFKFKDSNIKCVFVQTAQRSERSKFLVKVDGKQEYKNFSKVQIEGKEGEYVEKYDLVSKYERRLSMSDICLAQFAKMYTASWKQDKSIQSFELFDSNECSEKEEFIDMHTKIYISIHDLTHFI